MPAKRRRDSDERYIETLSNRQILNECKRAIDDGNEELLTNCVLHTGQESLTMAQLVNMLLKAISIKNIRMTKIIGMRLCGLAEEQKCKIRIGITKKEQYLDRGQSDFVIENISQEDPMSWLLGLLDIQCLRSYAYKFAIGTDANREKYSILAEYLAKAKGSGISLTRLVCYQMNNGSDPEDLELLLNLTKKYRVGFREEAMHFNEAQNETYAGRDNSAVTTALLCASFEHSPKLETAKKLLQWSFTHRDMKSAELIMDWVRMNTLRMNTSQAAKDFVSFVALQYALANDVEGVIRTVCEWNIDAYPWNCSFATVVHSSCDQRISKIIRKFQMTKTFVATCVSVACGLWASLDQDSFFRVCFFRWLDLNKGFASFNDYVHVFRAAAEKTRLIIKKALNVRYEDETMRMLHLSSPVSEEYQRRIAVNAIIHTSNKAVCVNKSGVLL